MGSTAIAIVQLHRAALTPFSANSQQQASNHGIAISLSDLVEVVMTNSLCRTEGGQKLEPIEEVVCEVEEEFGGAIIEALTLRKGEVISPSAASLQC